MNEFNQLTKIDAWAVADELLELILQGLDDGSLTMTQHRRDLFDGIYRIWIGDDVPYE